MTFAGLQHPVAVHAYIILMACAAYLSVYFIRVPVFAAFFLNRTAFGGVQLKVALAIAQVFGYAVGKPPSIWLCTRIQRHHRHRFLLVTITCAAGSLFLVATGVGELQCLGVFLSGFFMSAVWGVMVMYMEGRRGTEAIIAMTSLSYIAGGGIGKSAGALVLQNGVSEDWMPALLASGGVVSFAIWISLLNQAPDPSAHDIASRKRRPPPSKAQMFAFLRTYGVGVFSVLFAYTLAGASRLYRDFFSVELWTEVLEAEVSPATYTAAELPVSVCTLLVIALVVTVKDHKIAFFMMLGVIFGGIAVTGVITVLHSNDLVSGPVWLVVIGSGLFIALVPPGAMLWDRLMACSGNEMTTIFLIFIADAISYVASITMLLYRNFGSPQSSPGEFFTSFAIGVALVGCGLIVVAMGTFAYLLRGSAQKTLTMSPVASGSAGDNEGLLASHNNADPSSLNEQKASKV